MSEYFLLDVFAKERFQGNQLAVFAEGVNDEIMQPLAREINFSETTFITRVDRSSHKAWVRIFTPAVEVPFAGHPVIGTAYVLASSVFDDRPKRVELELKVGSVPVDVEWAGDKIVGLSMRQPKAVIGGMVDKARAVRALGLTEESLLSGLPVQIASTGLPAIFVPLRGLADMRAIRLDRNAYYELVNGLEAKALMAFTKEAYSPENHVNARMFAPAFGIEEDPATGSAAGALGAYLLEHRVLGQESIDIRMEQGVEIGRPSLISVKAGRAGVSVSGSVVPVARGSLL